MLPSGPICLVFCCRWSWPKGNSLPHISYGKASFAANQTAQSDECCLKRLWQTRGRPDSTIKKVLMWQFLLSSLAAGCPGSRQGVWEGDMTHVGFLLGTCSNRTEITVYAWIRFVLDADGTRELYTKQMPQPEKSDKMLQISNKEVYIFLALIFHHFSVSIHRLTIQYSWEY